MRMKGFEKAEVGYVGGAERGMNYFWQNDKKTNKRFSLSIFFFF